MAEFLTTAGTAHSVEQIITGAKAHLVLISPYLKLSPIFLERLQDADRRGVSIIVVYGKSELRQEQQDHLATLTNLTLHFLENLHAKCYMNEAKMVITSMNMYEFSEKNNREMGVLVTSDEPVYQDAAREVDSIIQAVERRPAVIAKAGAQLKARAAASRTGGSCIRCLREIPRNVARPLCRTCYDTWSAFGNPDYPERACHRCGTASNVSVARPLCRACYRTAQS